MTNKSIALSELADKGGDIDMLRDMLQFVTQRLMEMEVANKCNADYGQRTDERMHVMALESAYGKRAPARSILKSPNYDGSYFPPFLEPRRTAEKALTAVIQEAYI